MSPVAPDLSHYYGRAVEAINVFATHGEGEPSWALVLEGGIVINNYDDTLPAPGEHIVGQRFSTMTLSGKVTSMFFGGLGGNTVSLNPMKYAISDKSVMEEPYFPQVSEAQETWQPPPAPDERVVDGPDAEWQEEHPA